MKPIIITVDKNNKITMSVEEIKALLQDAFDQGRQCGTYVSYPVPWWYRWDTLTTPSITWTSGTTTIGSDSINSNSYSIAGTITAENKV